MNKKEHGKVVSNRSKVLVSMNCNNPYEPNAILKDVEDVIFIKSSDLIQTNQLYSQVSVSGIARNPKVTRVQCWHEKCGHREQKILKETIKSLIGLSGVDLSEIGSYETCHLSKTQRHVSRDNRFTPMDPLDEVFIDAMRRLPEVLNLIRYLVNLMDANKRMKWVKLT